MLNDQELNDLIDWYLRQQRPMWRDGAPQTEIDKHKPKFIQILQNIPLDDEPLNGYQKGSGLWFILNDIFETIKDLFDGSPDISEEEQADIIERAQFWQQGHDLNTLGNGDYQARAVTSPEIDPNHLLIQQGIEKLHELAETFSPGIQQDAVAIKRAIEVQERRLKDLDSGSITHQDTQHKIALLKDFNKLVLLKSVQIPSEHDAPDQSYYELAESAGGVTEKVSLVSGETLHRQLTQLVDASPENLGAYVDHRQNYKLSTEAILKLPKHGKLEEVQRESIALNISNILGLQTTQSSMVSYDDKPALFVPFERIQLLSDVADGQTMQARLFSTKKYLHYSTLNAPGAGLQAEDWLDEFGEAMGLSYLCSDTDFIGGYNQNKAIKDNRLFVFDQVLMGDDKLGLDSRLSLQPIEAIMMHTRHGQGRNRTLVEDSSLRSKWDSLQSLKQSHPKIDLYLRKLIRTHETNLRTLTTQLAEEPNQTKKTEIKEQIRQVTDLLTDAKSSKDVVDRRIKAIDAVIPVMPEGLKGQAFKVLVLEKLFNQPRLYTEDGRPYRHPWTKRNTLNIHSIRKADEDGYLNINTNQPVSIDQLKMIKRHAAFDHPLKVSTNNKSILIHQDDLAKLEENILYPEHATSPHDDVHYLEVNDLKTLKNAYNTGQREPIIKAVEIYQTELAGADSNENKLKALDKLSESIKANLEQAKDKGFAFHVLKKYQHEKYQQLKKMMPEDTNTDRLDQAFSAAIRLDRVEAFNHVVQVAIIQNRVDNPLFTTFQQVCIDKEQQVEGSADKHAQALEESTFLMQFATNTAEVLNLPEEELERLQGVAEEPVIEIQADDLEGPIEIPDLELNPEIVMVEAQAREREVLGDVIAIGQRRVPEPEIRPEVETPKVFVN